MPEQSGSARVYHDMDGLPCTLRALIANEPEWAHSRITHMEARIKELELTMIKEAAFVLRERFSCGDDAQAERFRLCGIRIADIAKKPS